MNFLKKIEEIMGLLDYFKAPEPAKAAPKVGKSGKKICCSVSSVLNEVESD